LSVRRGEAGFYGMKSQTRIAVIDLSDNLALLDRIPLDDRSRDQPTIEPACHGDDLTLHPRVVFRDVDGPPAQPLEDIEPADENEHKSKCCNDFPLAATYPGSRLSRRQIEGIERLTFPLG
jgi:hypothetical protein